VSVAAIAALVVTGVLVAALAFYLLRVVAILRRLIDTLGKVLFGVRAIAHRVEPVGAILTEVNDDLTAVAEALESLADDLGAGDRAQEPARAS
jgi:hypothetical protein